MNLIYFIARTSNLIILKHIPKNKKGNVNTAMEYKIFKSSYLDQNSTLLHDGQAAIIIDPGVLPAEMAGITEYLERENLELQAVLFTHTHGDHFAGWNHLPEVPFYAGSGYAEKTDERREKDLLFIGNIFRSNHVETDIPIKFPDHINLLENGESVQVTDFNFTFYHTPGHSIDQAMIHCQELAMVFSGDMLIKSPFPFILESVLQYRMSLGYMRRIVNDNEVKICVPGHYREAVGEEIKQRISGEIEYIDKLYRFLFDQYNPSMSNRELEEAMLHMDPKRINVHFTHKMNVSRLISEIRHLI